MPANPIPKLRSRLRSFRRRYPEVIRRSGISRSWLSKFANGKLGKRPGYDLLGRLITTLDAMEREAARNGSRGKRGHGGTVDGRKTLAKPRIKQQKANTRKARG